MTRCTPVITHNISIHALREEGDQTKNEWFYLPYLFLSTPSARRATCFSSGSFRRYLFLSTPSARRATNARLAEHQRTDISIHALREEGDGSSS